MAAAPQTMDCPRCGSPVTSLVSVDAGLRLQLLQADPEGQIPQQVCTKCFTDLRKKGSQGSRLKAHAKAKEDHRKQLWQSRVALVKSARAQMTAKKYSEAAVAYEKYIRSLEIVFETNPGTLTPEHFKSKSYQKELTVISSVLWDLICIYDTSPRYGNRMMKAVDKLAEFARFTPIYGPLIKKAQSFERKANNPKLIKRFLTTANSQRRFCFIATTVFTEHHNPETELLCAFRDQVLTQSRLGRAVIEVYYMMSPSLAWALASFARPLQPFVRHALRFIAFCLQKIIKIEPHSR